MYFFYLVTRVRYLPYGTGTVPYLTEVAVERGAHDDGTGDDNQSHHDQDVDEVVLQRVPPGPAYVNTIAIVID